MITEKSFKTISLKGHQGMKPWRTMAWILSLLDWKWFLSLFQKGSNKYTLKRWSEDKSVFYGSVLGPHWHFLFVIFHTLICKIHTLTSKFYTLICKIYTLICKIFIEVWKIKSVNVALIRFRSFHLSYLMIFYILW